MKLFGFEIGRIEEIEQPPVELAASAPADPVSDLISSIRAQLLSGVDSTAGASVNDDTVLTLSAAFACMRVIAEDVATTPLVMYQRTPDGRGRKRATDRSLYYRLRDTPNPEMTAFTFKEMMCYQMLLPSGGAAFAEIERSQYDGSVKALWPLLAKDVEIRRDPDTSEIFYRVSVPKSGGFVDLPNYNVLWIPGMATEAYNGRSPAKVAANVIGLSLAIEKFAGLHFANGGFVKDYLRHPSSLGEKAAKSLRETWISGHGSLNMAQRTAILEEGMEYVAVMQELGKILPAEVRAQQVVEVCRLFRMQPNKVQEYGRATWSNSEQMNTAHYTDCLLPWFTRWEQACNWKLTTSGERDIFFEFLADNFLRGDYETRTKGYATLVQNGLATRNEIRAMENLPPIDGGDEVFVPLNMAPLSKVISGEILPSGSAKVGDVSK